MKDIVFDLETWGTTPGSDIRSIGAVEINLSTGEVFRDAAFYIACDNPTIGYNELLDRPIYKYPLTRSDSTIEWWADQSEEAQAAFTNPADLRHALIRYHNWVKDVEGDPKSLRIWSHGSHFDVPIIEAAFRACDLLNPPWHYRSPRDTRTIFEAAGFDAENTLQMFSEGTHHHALDDAFCTGRAICAAYAVINTLRRLSDEQHGYSEGAGDG